jgi:SAM-dependent methyltransferase
VTSTTTADLWHHYGRSRAATDRAVPDAFHWSWDQASGPGPEVLGDLTDACVADLGAGTARHAAYLATRHQVARVDAVDASAAQHEMAVGLYGHLAPRLQIVAADVVEHLQAMPGAYDVLYSVFGAVCFTEPRHLLPVAAGALRSGGRLVFSTLAHYLNGAVAQPDVVPADVPAKTPDGQSATMRRWVLQEHVWTKLLDEAGFKQIALDVLPAAPGRPRPADTLLVTARRA